jgi:hypothetical protein
VDNGRLEHRALERNPVLGLVRIFLDRRAIVRNRGIPVVALARFKPLAIRNRRGTATERGGDEHQHGEPEERSGHESVSPLRS